MDTSATTKFDQTVAEKSNDELLAILAQPDDWQAGALEAAKLLLQRRPVEINYGHLSHFLL